MKNTAILKALEVLQQNGWIAIHPKADREHCATIIAQHIQDDEDAKAKT